MRVAPQDSPKPDVLHAGYALYIANLEYMHLSGPKFYCAIINIMPKHIDAWLTPERRSVEEIQAILDDPPQAYYEHQVAKAA
ncbi:SOS response-associated peptidase [Pseudoxanthomonas sp. CF385]|uniref:SOS response-associated peptidase n=1 Tax=Pseudoxanthomonas sp. CF385 TaxID=1881042 RepID=UPI0011138871|nr:SOS response-associated peptidase [Pseudoxanthomonas sp. CF385]